MPLPLIPIIAGIAALSSAGYGVKKGVDAIDNTKKAKKIADIAKEEHEEAVQKLEIKRKETNRKLEELGLLKAEAFRNQIAHAIQLAGKKKHAKSRLNNHEEEISNLLLPETKQMVEESLNVIEGFLTGTASGAATAFGAYGTVGALGVASTGTAIGSLSGVAATNATLAWLGGGSLASGGLGIAGGTAVLGGIVAGPALAITGLVMASQSEKALTQAKEYAANVEKKIQEIEVMKKVMRAHIQAAEEQESCIQQLTERYDAIRVDDWDDEKAADNVIALATGLKQVLNTPIIDKEGNAIPDVRAKIVAITKGALEVSA